MIANGIKFLCRKLVDLVNLVSDNGLDFDSCITFSQTKHADWTLKIIDTVDRLKKWEMTNIGEPTFSKAFDLLLTKLRVKNTEGGSLLKNSSSRKVIPTENSLHHFSEKASDRLIDSSVPISHMMKTKLRSRTENIHNLNQQTSTQKSQNTSQGPSPYTKN